MRKQDYYEEEKRDSKYRLLSELERYEIFNTEEAEKYDTQQALDFIIDEKGNLQFLLQLFQGAKMDFLVDGNMLKFLGATLQRLGPM